MMNGLRRAILGLSMVLCATSLLLWIQSERPWGHRLWNRPFRWEHGDRLMLVFSNPGRIGVQGYYRDGPEVRGPRFDDRAASEAFIRQFEPVTGWGCFGVE